MEIDYDTVERTDDALEGGVGCGDDLEGNESGEGVRDGDDFNNITPKIGMEFPTSEDAYKFYNRYALKMGFGSRKSTSMKALEIAYKSPNFADEFSRFLTRKLVEYDKFEEPNEVVVPSQVDPIIPPLSQNSCNFISEINIRDPTAPARHKGRPRVPSRLKSGLEVSQEESTKKQKTCGFCGEKGHYRTGCSKAKENEVACRNQFVAGVSQAHSREG